MSTLTKRNTWGGAAILSLLAALHAPVSLAVESDGRHARDAAEIPAPDTEANRNTAPEKAASRQMDQGDSVDRHGGAGSNHGH